MNLIQTVTGPIHPDDLGIVLLHEHVYSSGPDPDADGEDHSDFPYWDLPITIDILGALRRGAPNRQNSSLDDEGIAAEELGHFAAYGGTTVVDNTGVGLNRDPVALRRIAEATGVNIITTTGFYKHGMHPPWVAKMTIDQVAELMITEITEGIDGTGIRAGSIGECACSEEPLPYHPEEEKILRAACRAQIRTGVGFTIHPSIFDAVRGGIATVGEAYVDLIEQEGADLDSFYLSHCDLSLDHLDYHRRLLDRGITISYDTFGYEGLNMPAFLGGCRMPGDIERVDAIAMLCHEGYDRQIVMAQDVGVRLLWKRFGGSGYSLVLEWAVPMLRARGVTESQIHNMLVENPRRILTPSAGR
ncbi:MAG: hypothetical protein OXM57_12270 [bacterium]|nr:hypothetical protein [bacterium]MDE0353455.1 hypothetical protein [bacterium]